MKELAPGYILQQMFIKRRLRALYSKSKQNVRFYEVGTGKGANTSILLKMGFSGVGYELNPKACLTTALLNKQYIDAGKFVVKNENFITTDIVERVDFVFSSMVIEHLSQEEVAAYINKCKAVLKPNGVVISLVPANMKYWGIEDEVAGHYKRYEFKCFDQLAKQHGMEVFITKGLTFPLSNWLLGISNKLVKEQESKKLELTLQERTELSGNRDVKFKTVYPAWFSIFLNEVTMSPFHWLQLLNGKNEKSMVIYNELKVANNGK